MTITVRKASMEVKVTQKPNSEKLMRYWDLMRGSISSDSYIAAMVLMVVSLKNESELMVFREVI